MKKNKVLIISAINPTKAYSGVKYMFDKLKPRYDTSLWAMVSKECFPEYTSWGSNVFSFYNIFLGKIPKIRMIAMKFKGFLLCARYRNQTIICHETYHYKSACLVKRFFPHTKLIHYCTEMYNAKSAGFQKRQMKHYIKHASSPDLIIECNKERRDYRRKKYNISKPQVVIDNTIPFSEIQTYMGEKKFFKEVPEIIYSGGCHTDYELDILINALDMLDFEYKAKLIVYGVNHAIEQLKEKCRKISKDRISIITGLTRSEVLPIVAKADIGIVYYDPEYSINCQYAAPTKFFEYIGLGVPVVTSSNESLMRVINQFGIGAYMKTNDAKGMAEAISSLYDIKDRIECYNNEKYSFSKFLSYEQQSREAYVEIMNLIEEN